MDILNRIIDFFGVGAISDARTFPELLQAMVYLFMACFVVIFMVRILCSLNENIANLNARR